MVEVKAKAIYPKCVLAQSCECQCFVLENVKSWFRKIYFKSFQSYCKIIFCTGDYEKIQV